MLLFVCISAAIWALGAVMKVPGSLRWTMISCVYLGVLLAVLVLPESNGLRVRLGGSVPEWILFGGLAGLIALYRVWFKKIRVRAQKTQAQREQHLMTDTQTATPKTAAKTGFASGEIERYMRHIMLREIGGPGQGKLKTARVLVIGAGGLGAPVLQYLAASGVGTIGVIDDDVVETSNLQRQVIHMDAMVGQPKVHSAAQLMRAQNPFVEVKPYHRRFDENCVELLDEYDLIIDGCDNFKTRYLVNSACVAAKKPLLSAAITQWEGQLSTYAPEQGGPCYQCVFPEVPADGLAPSCAEAGVAAPLPGILGTMLAMEAVKFISGAGTGLVGRLLIYDALEMQTRMIKVKKREDCRVCGKK